MEELNTEDANKFAMLCHLSALAGFVIPFGNIIGPLIVWMIKKDEFPAVDRHGKESINFQLSVTLYVFIGIILIFLFIGIILLAIIGVGALVLQIIAAVKANDGEEYRYPLTIRFIK